LEKSPDTKGSLVQKIGERVGSGDWGTKSYKDIMSSAYLPDKSEGLLSGSRQLDTLSDDSMMKMYKQGGNQPLMIVKLPLDLFQNYILAK